MPLKTFRKCMKHVDVKRVNVLKLYNFGELLLYPDLKGLMKEVDRLPWKCDVEISTNGSIVSREKLTDLIKPRLIDTFGISADGDGSELGFESTRPPAKWSNFLDFLGVVKEVRAEYHPKMKVVLKLIGEESKLSWLCLAEEYGFKCLFMNRRNVPDSVAYKPYVSSSRACKHVESTRNRLYVDWDGKVVPCCCHPRAHVFGDLTKEKYSKILNGPARRRFVHMDRRKHPICGKCGVK